jgi:pimeloyl-ACP methyl ester carboxylesterase
VTTFVLVPGAGGIGWYWHRLVAELARRGHQAVPVDLPGADPQAGLVEYRQLIVDAAPDGGDPVTLVAHSLGAFSAPLACEQLAVERLILVNPMIPQPGETAGEWWDAVGWSADAQASAEREGRPEPDVTDLETLFFHDLPPDLAEVMRSGSEAANEGPAVFAQPWPLREWPAVPTRVLAGRDDRFFPLSLQRRVARQRLNLDIEELPGGHLLALSQPAALATQIAPQRSPLA